MDPRPFLLLLVLLGATIGLRGQTTVDTLFEPSTIREDETSVFRVTLRAEGSGSVAFANAGPPRLPPVEGLRFRYLGPSQELRIVNGETTVRLTHLFRAIPGGPGTYEVPSFPVEAGDRTVEAPPATLRVLGRGQTPDDPGSAAGADRRPAWMEIDLPRDFLYVGEAVPTKVRLFLNSRKVVDASLDADHPEKIGDAFSIGEFGPMSQNQISLDGLPVTIADWHVLLTPLKTGDQPLVFEIPLVVSLREAGNRRRDPFDSFFGPSPFRSLFDRERIRAYSDDREVGIRPLPDEGRPDGFSGGIGRFEVAGTEVSSDEVQVGEPFLYTVRIRGEGNFDRLGPPALAGDEADWRLYDPESSFSARDSLGYSGTKSFTFTLIPRSAGIDRTPKFSLGFFSPSDGEYRSLEIPPRPLAVRPAPDGPSASPAGTEPANPVESRRGPDLLPIVARWPGAGGNLAPLWTRPWFLALQGILAVLLLVANRILRHRARLRNDPAYARRERARKASRKALAGARREAGRRDAPAFYAAACDAIREAAGPWQEGAPESSTEEETIRAIRAAGFGGDLPDEARRFFRAAESLHYGGAGAAPSDLSAEAARLDRLLRNLRRPPRRKAAAGGPGAALLLAAISAGAWLAGPPADLRAEETPAATAEGNPEPESRATTALEAGHRTEARRAFDRGVEAYRAGEYRDAVDAWNTLAPAYPSAALHFNLGNAHYRLREYPRAILHYERGLVLAPSDPDLRANLALAREAAGVDPPPGPPLAAFGRLLPPAGWTWLVAAGIWGLAATLALARAPKVRPFRRRLFVFLSGAVLVAGILGQTPWFAARDRAVVLAPEAPLRIAPTATSPLETRLAAGSTGLLGEGYGEYARFRLPGGPEGWVLRGSVRRIR